MNTARESAQLTTTLGASIRQGRIEAGSYLPTVRELSEEHGVAHNTAWRVLKTLERQGLVVAQPRKGYRVVGAGDPVNKPLAYVLSRENFHAGWDLLYRNLLNAFEQLAIQQHSYLLQMIMKTGDERMVLDHLKQDSLSGLVVDTPNLELLAWADRQGIPSVVVDDWCPDLGHDAVVQDNFAGGQLAAQHLLSTGCRRLAWFGKKLDHYHAHARYGGALPAVAAAGKSFEFHYFLDLNEDGLVQSAMNMLARADRPDGVLALWRPMTNAVAKAARRLGLRMGVDVHVVGWINEEAVEAGYLPLFEGGPVAPAVTWRAADMAMVALAALAQRRSEPRRPQVCHLVPVRLRQDFS